MLDFDDLEEREVEEGVAVYIETEEEIRRRVEEQFFKREVDLETSAALRCEKTEEEMLEGTILGVLVTVDFKDPSDPKKKRSMFFCEAVNQAHRKLRPLFVDQRRLSRVGATGYEERIDIILAWLTFTAIHKRFEVEALNAFEKIAHLFHGENGLSSLLSDWIIKDQRNNRLSVETCLRDIVDQLAKLPHYMIASSQYKEEIDTGVRHVSQLVLPKREGCQDPVRVDNVPDWARHWRDKCRKLVKSTPILATRILWELRELYTEEPFKQTFQKLRKEAKLGNLAHTKLLELTWAIQSKVLPKYGYDATAKGLQEMRDEMQFWAGRNVWEFKPSGEEIEPDAVVWKIRRDIHSILEMGAPLPRMPVARYMLPQRFPLHEKDRWIKHLADEGFVVIGDVVSEEEVGVAYRLLWDFIEQSDTSGKIRRNDLSTWLDTDENHTGWPAGKADGIIHGDGIGQSKLLWYLRSLPAVRGAFGALWGTNRLVASFDGAGVFRPYGHNKDWKITRKESGWCHVDQAHTKTGVHCVQGLIPLKDATEKTGGLVVVPGSHRFYEGHLLRSYKRSTWDFIECRSNDPVLTEGNSGPRLVCAKKGDLCLWDSRTIHCNTLPLTEDPALLQGDDLIRAVAYVCMTPAAWCSDEVVQKREAAFTKGVTTSHWPHEHHAMDTPNVHPGFELTQEMQELLCPQKLPSWPKDEEEAARGAPKAGRVSLLPEMCFVVTYPVVPIRSQPTLEFGEDIGCLSQGQYISGYLFGHWLRLTSCPKEQFSIPEGEETWVVTITGSSREATMLPLESDWRE